MSREAGSPVRCLRVPTRFDPVIVPGAAVVEVVGGARVRWLTDGAVAGAMRWRGVTVPILRPRFGPDRQGVGIRPADDDPLIVVFGAGHGAFWGLESFGAPSIVRIQEGELAARPPGPGALDALAEVEIPPGCAVIPDLDRLAMAARALGPLPSLSRARQPSDSTPSNSGSGPASCR